MSKSDKRDVVALAAEDSVRSCSSDLWTTVYQPDTAKDIIGNAESVTMLTTWLHQWKKVCLSSWRKEQASPNRRNKKMKKNGFSQLDSDYDSESDSSGNGNELCNTVLLLGPNGCGKTSTVFALAKELGFEVIEVNAATKRSGKLVLSRLREATQSHHVNDSKSLNLSPSKVKSSFFASKGDDKTTEKSLESKGTKNHEKCEEKGPAPVSLILFEDVDVVFAEDDGFWGAVNTFMSSAKRPIILTSSDLMFDQRECIKENYDVVNFQRPNPALQALQLQLMALAELSFLPPKDLLHLVKSNSGDTRKSMLMLQFYCKYQHQGVIRTCKGKDSSSNTLNKEMNANDNNKESLTEAKAHDQSGDAVLPGKLVTECHGLSELFCPRSFSIRRLFNGHVYAELLRSVETPASPSEDSESIYVCESEDSTKLSSLNNIKALRRISSLADSLVDLDLASPEASLSFTNDAEVAPGLEDEGQIEENGHYRGLLGAAVDTTLSLRHSLLQAEQLKPTADKGTSSSLEEPTIKTCAEEPHNVLSVLPLDMRLHRRDFYLDYLPVLRSICRTETFKSSTRTKRRGRFSHYLNSNVLYLDKDTIGWLGTHFQQGQD